MYPRARCRLSASTVSRVLNAGAGSKLIGDETRRKVRDAMAHLGYSPSPIAKALRGGHSNLIEPILREIADPFIAQLSQELTTCYIERLNGTFRQQLTWLTRRTRTLAHRADTLVYGMYLLGSVSNFCGPHALLSLPDRSPLSPAMAAGLTDHRWSILELLTFKVAPSPYVPPKRRGRKPKTVLLAVSA